MKNSLLLFTVFIFSLSNGLSQEKLPADQKAVQHTVVKMFDALSDRDSVALKSYCTSDVLFLEYGMVWTLDTLIRKAIRFNQSKNFKRVNTIDFITTEIHKDVAWVTYNNQAEIIQDDNRRNLKWLETVVMVKKHKIWKIKLLHSTYLKVK